MCDFCRLCEKKADLRNSHIIPKFFFNEVKRNSLTKKMRCSTDINKIKQDGVKPQFLCAECEELFSKYEKFFSENIYENYKKFPNFILNSDNDKLRYFVLSICWRYIKYYIECRGFVGVPKEKSQELVEKLNIWREILLNEDLCKLSKLDMFLIPYDGMIDFNANSDVIVKKFLKQNNVSVDFDFFNDDWGECLFFLKVPHIILVVVVLGNCNSMENNKIGNKITIEKTDISEEIYYFIKKMNKDFKDKDNQLSDKQRQATEERIKRKLNFK